MDYYYLDFLRTTTAQVIFPIKILVFPSGRDVSTGGRHFSSLEIEGGDRRGESVCVGCDTCMQVTLPYVRSYLFFFLGLHHDEMAPPGKEKINR